MKKLDDSQREQLYSLLSDNFGDLRGQVKATRHFGPEPGLAILDAMSMFVASAPDKIAAEKVHDLRKRTKAELAVLKVSRDSAKKAEEREAIDEAAARYAATQASGAVMQAVRALQAPDPAAARNKVRQRVLAAVGGL